MRLEPEKRKGARGQGMVEFAITIPIVLILMLGVIEFGRLIFFYATISSAGREAARYGSGVGNTNGTPLYNDCTGIKDAAIRIGQFAGIKATNIRIFHDSGPTYTLSDLPKDPSVSLDPTKFPPNKIEEYCKADNKPTQNPWGQEDRIVVQINVTYVPISPLVNLPSFPLYSQSAHSIVKGAVVKAMTPTPNAAGGATCPVGPYKIIDQSDIMGPVDIVTIQNTYGIDTTVDHIMVVWDTTGGPVLKTISFTPNNNGTPGPPITINVNSAGPIYEADALSWAFPANPVYSHNPYPAPIPSPVADNNPSFTLTFSKVLKNPVIIRLTYGGTTCAFGQ